jgi:hypothetical protein
MRVSTRQPTDTRSRSENRDQGHDRMIDPNKLGTYIELKNIFLHYLIAATHP